MGFTRRLRRFVIVAGMLLAGLAVEIGWFAATKGMSASEAAAKRRLVAPTGLPDLAVATEARFLRFRSLADVYSPFNEGPELLDYFPAAFTYAPSPVERKMPSRIEQKP